ncbi:sporulation integral membrane protein YlbJ [Bacillus sp. FSL K6-3431]|uniref:sporulation integral membrane protein YlbJ n=1 Tax=Bacillus sp. FSL K6-3431 TaxID=2921500 RepID=UPI0030F6DAFA
MKLSIIKTFFLALVVTIMAFSMILLPKESFEASIRGLNMWWEIVFPSLFPFFVISELLIGFGVVRFLGVLLEPFMRPLFRVPGVGGFAWAMGMATGFPAGAKLTSHLRMEGHLTRIEAERLVSFTNSSSPLFIFGAVSIGFFQNPRLGFLLAFAHYLGNFFVGITMRYYGSSKTKKGIKRASSRTLFVQALAALHHTRIKNNKPLGKLLGDAVISSIHTLLMIGGFIILFSVINKILFHLHITSILAKLMGFVLGFFQLPAELSTSLIAGLFEITLGSQMSSEVHAASMMAQVIVVSFILGFSGFSVQAQVASIIAQTDIRFKPFFFARILHGLLAGFFAFVLWKLIPKTFYLVTEDQAVPAIVFLHDTWWANIFHFFAKSGPLITIFSLLIYIFIYFSKTKKT